MFGTDRLPAGPGTRLHRVARVALACCALVVLAGGAQGESGLPRDSAVQDLVADRLTLSVGQAEVVRYAREPGTVIIGDPRVATASLASSDILVLTGLEAGETNLIVLDDSGVQIDRMTLRIVDRGETVVLRRGVEREVHRCHPLCLPTGAASGGQTDPAPSRVIEGVRAEGGGAAAEGGGG